MIRRRQEIVREILNVEMMGLILPIEVGDNHRVMEIQKVLQEEMGVSVGAIRQPTVKKAIIRVIARLDLEEGILIRVCERFRDIWVK